MTAVQLALARTVLALGMVLSATSSLQAAPACQAASPARETTAAVQAVPPATPVAAPRWPTQYPTGATASLGARIAALLSDPQVAGAHWGIAVTARDGTPIYGFDEAKLFRPASTAKLFTTAAAMAVLGPTATADTLVYLPAPAADGTVQGDITLVGYGDANLGAQDVPWVRSGSSTASKKVVAEPFAELNHFAAQLAAKNVRRITGKVIASRSPWEPYPQGWEAEDLLWGYGAPVAGLSLADNTLRLTVKAGAAASEPALVTLVPDVSFYRLVSIVRTTDDTSQPPQVNVHHVPGDGTLRLDGLIPFGKTYTAEIAVDDPPAFAAKALQQALQAAGIAVVGGIEANRKELPEINFLHEARTPIRKDVATGTNGDALGGQQEIVLRHTSPLLAEDVVATMKESLNLHAELILRHLGNASGLPLDLEKGPAVEGARVVHQWLVDGGLNEHDFILYDGSGLSTKDLVTPRAEVQLLAYAATQPWFPQWKAALPVGGVDGTLAGRFTQSPLRGHLFAKTGTLGESRALAGFVQCASGREVIFSILDDNHEPGSAADRAVMDKIVEAIAVLN